MHHVGIIKSALTYKDVSKAYIDGTTVEDGNAKDIKGCQQDLY